MEPTEGQFAAHRGIFVAGDRHSSNSGLGVHWSASERVAEEMASHASQVPEKRVPHPKDKTIIYHGSIPASSVETNVDTLRANKVLSPDDLSKNKEREIPVKKGAKINVTSSTKASKRNDVWKTRNRTYTPPREMRA